MTDPLERLIEEAERALSSAGARAWEICVTEEESASVEVVDGELRAEESARERSVGLRVLDGGIGFAGLADPTMSALRTAAEAAIAEARSVRGAAIAAFEGREASGTSGAPFGDPRATARPGARLRDAAARLEVEARTADPRIVGARPAVVSEVRGRFRLRTSAGLDVEESSSRAFAHVAALARSPRGETQLASTTASAAAVEGLALSELAVRSAARAVARLGARGFRTASVPIVLAPEVVAELLEVVVAALAGEAVDRGASFVRAAGAGLPLLGEAFTLLDDPHDPELDGASWFDGEGLPTRRTRLIDRGAVSALLDDRETAARGGRPPGAHALRASGGERPHPGAHALVLAPGTRTTAELLGAGAGGLWIDELIGAHTISEITGALSVGAIGRRILRRGALGAPVEGITLAGTVQALLGRGAEPSAEPVLLGHARVPAVFVEAVQVASGG